jgi:hypothetical protein
MPGSSLPLSFWLMWFVAFAGFPIGGLLANLIVGPATGTVNAALGGAITGAVLGLVQWLVLWKPFAMSPAWIIATCVGTAAGLAAGAALLGSETGDVTLLQRACITGLSVGAAQGLVLAAGAGLSLPPVRIALWVGTIGLGWTAAWYITRRAGIDLAPKWVVFGSFGAWAFQLLTGLAIYRSWLRH